MKIGVIGTFIRDRIFPWQRPELSSIGGIFFTVSYLANLLGSSDEIYPVCNIGTDFYDEVSSRLLAYPNVRLDGLTKLARDNTQVRLYYTGPQERDEITTAPMPPVTFEQTLLLKEADAVIVNLITGCDVELAALRRFRQASQALVYLDFHSHALGIGQHGERFYSRPPDWREWIDQVDVLQVNEMEARTLAGLTEAAPVELLVEFGRQVLQLRPSVCHITLADKGSYLCYSKQGEVHVQRVPAQHVSDVVDIIGCGDAFEAAYVVKALGGADEITATAFAHRVAAANCTFLGSTGIKEIQRMIG
ncbi:MAG: carbohydrate kinase family protein [bacterium]